MTTKMILRELKIPKTAPIYAVASLLGDEADKRCLTVARWQNGFRNRNSLRIVWAVFWGMAPAAPAELPEDALMVQFSVPEGAGGNKTQAYRALRSLLQRVMELPVEEVSTNEDAEKAVEA